MATPPANPNPAPLLILYDGTCSLCTGTATRFESTLRKRGFALATLQSDVGRPFATGEDEMKLVIAAPGGVQVCGGAEAIAFICKQIWWAWPLAWLWAIPPLRWPLRGLYRYIAQRRHCASGACAVPRKATGNPKNAG